MNSSSWLLSPIFSVLFKWTCLLAFGWLVHGLLHRRDARWRLILWRSILCFGVLLPWLQFFPVPGIKIPVPGEFPNEMADNGASAVNVVGSSLPAVAAKPSSPAIPGAIPTKISTTATRVSVPANSRLISSLAKSISWETVVVGIWLLGCIYGLVRLSRLNRQLGRLRRESCEPVPELQQLVAQIRLRLQVRQTVAVHVSDAVTSPFVCGLREPAIILPRTLAQQLPSAEMAALVSHEMAHLRRHDLFWSVAWRWLQAICWFHPLIWKVPAAHNLACEQEADRVASDLADRDSYSQMLARLVLRVLALPPLETRLVLNGSSHIARRLNYLGQKGGRAWNWKYSMAAFGLTGMLFLMTAGCEVSRSTDADEKPLPASAFKKVLIVVQDDQGRPVAGATVLPSGFRVKGIHAADAYFWNKKLFGPPEPVVTDGEGNAYLKYPVEGIPEEREFTGKLILEISHPQFAPVYVQEYSVDKPEKPVRLTPGVHLRLSGYHGSDHQPVTELIVNLNQALISTNDLQSKADGAIELNQLSPGGHILQLMGKLASGEIVYSQSQTFTAKKGKEYHFDLELKPGIRLEGRIDDRVPRPIKNGRVLIDIRPPEFPAWTNWTQVGSLFKEYPGVYFWRSYRPIAEDGTFVFESVPPGGLDVVVHGDGFVSKDGGEFADRNGPHWTKVRGFAVPQAFALTAPTTTIVVATEPTATLEVTAKTKRGKPVAGATIHLNPNVIRMNGILGDVRQSNEAPFRDVPSLPNVPYSAVTDQNGMAVIRNVPAITARMEVFHPQFQVPLQDPKSWRNRSIDMAFSPGATNHYELTLEPKGTDYIGKNLYW
jgi:beta-lactamase regulating signal transducer with metallopeptidase domain